MSWFEAYNASQSIAYYWGVYNIIMLMAALAFAKTNNQD